MVQSMGGVCSLVDRSSRSDRVQGNEGGRNVQALEGSVRWRFRGQADWVLAGGDCGGTLRADA